MLKIRAATLSLLLALACAHKWAPPKPNPDAARLPKVISQVHLVAVGDIMMHYDVKKAAISVLRHRISTNFQAQAEGMTTEDVILRLLKEIKEPEVAKFA